MKLHICTMCSRPEFLEMIFSTIPINDDIVWHIAKSSSTPAITGKFAADSRVRIYELPCEDTNTPCKMNFIFNKIIESGIDSYFCMQDDDSLFLEQMYNVYKQYTQKQFMVIGQQLDKLNQIRLVGTYPYECAIDTGNVLIHSSVLVKEQWGNKHWDETYHADFDFINRCFKHFGIKRTDIITEPISVYNALSTKIDSLDYIRTN